jgi:uncharacterized protein (DUF362 family)
MSKISIKRYSGDLKQTISEALFSVVAGPDLKNKSILIKVNACRPGYAMGQVTDPEFLRATIKILKDYTTNITICESDGQRFSAWKSLEKTGIKNVALEEKIKIVNLSELPLVSVDIPSFLYFSELKIPDITLNTDVFIDMCLMKTHKLTDVSLGLKNLFGCLPGYDRVLIHSHINEILADIASVIKPDISLMDAIVGMEGDGPIAGIPKRMNLVLCSDNVVALDYVASKIMGFNPDKILHICKAAKNMPTGEIEIVGSSVEQVRSYFKRPAYDFISKIERRVQQNSLLARWVYLNPYVFKIVKWVGWKIRDLTGYTKRYEKDLMKSGENVGLYDIITSKTGD